MKVLFSLYIYLSFSSSIQTQMVRQRHSQVTRFILLFDHFTLPVVLEGPKLANICVVRAIKLKTLWQHEMDILIFFKWQQLDPYLSCGMQLHAELLIKHDHILSRQFCSPTAVLKLIFNRLR